MQAFEQNLRRFRVSDAATPEHSSHLKTRPFPWSKYDTELVGGGRSVEEGEQPWSEPLGRAEAEGHR